MAGNTLPTGGPVDYELTRIGWTSMSGENTRDIDSEVGYWAEGLFAGMLAGSGRDPEQAWRMTRAARASAVILDKEFNLKG